MREVGKWPDQNGQCRLSAPVSEFVEAGEPIERRSPKENVTVTTSCSCLLAGRITFAHSATSLSFIATEALESERLRQRQRQRQRELP